MCMRAAAGYAAHFIPNSWRVWWSALDLGGVTDRWGRYYIAAY